MDIELTQYQQLLLEAAQKWAFACYESRSCEKDKWEALEQAKIEFKMLLQQAMTISDWGRVKGTVCSPAKEKAARINGKLGGRPRKHIIK